MHAWAGTFERGEQSEDSKAPVSTKSAVERGRNFAACGAVPDADEAVGKARLTFREFRQGLTDEIAILHRELYCLKELLKYRNESRFVEPVADLEHPRELREHDDVNVGRLAGSLDLFE